MDILRITNFDVNVIIVDEVVVFYPVRVGRSLDFYEGIVVDV